MSSSAKCAGRNVLSGVGAGVARKSRSKDEVLCVCCLPVALATLTRRAEARIATAKEERENAMMLKLRVEGSEQERNEERSDVEGRKWQ